MRALLTKIKYYMGKTKAIDLMCAYNLQPPTKFKQIEKSLTQTVSFKLTYNWKIVMQSLMLFKHY